MDGGEGDVVAGRRSTTACIEFDSVGTTTGVRVSTNSKSIIRSNRTNKLIWNL